MPVGPRLWELEEQAVLEAESLERADLFPNRPQHTISFAPDALAEWIDRPTVIIELR